MKKLILIILTLCSAQAWGAAYTSCGSGNWSAPATWNDGVLGCGLTITVPGVGDTATILATHTVTVDDTRTIPSTTAEGTLVQGTGVVTTLGGILTVGNGSTEDGHFTFGGGSTLAMGANNLVLNNCFLRSNATSGNWTIITGTGAITMGAVYSAPKQDIILSYVSHQNTGNITYAAGGTSGTGETNQINIQHCVFSGTGIVTIGQAGWTPASTVITVNNNDFINLTGNIKLTGATGTVTNATFNYNTVNLSTSHELVLNNATGYQIKGNTLVNVTSGVVASNTAPAITYDSNFWSLASSAASGTNTLILNNAYAAPTFTNNYVYSTYANPHSVGETGTGGSGTVSVGHNIFETVYSTDPGNYVMVGKLPININNNIMINSGAICNNVGAQTGTTVNCYNNTAWITRDNAGSGGSIWLTETGLFTGTVNVYNNLVSGAVTGTYGVASISGTQALATVGYNSFYATTTPYSSVTVVTDNRANDLAVNPSFSDTSRSLATWNHVRGSGTTSAADAVTYLLGTNGYNGNTFTQSATPSANSVTDLMLWTTAGFAPTNMALATAGYGGTYIGAVMPQASLSPIWGIQFGL